MIATPWPTIALVAIYLFIVKVGPKVMENRKAYSLREVLIVYNLALVALSAWMVYEVSATLELFIIITFTGSVRAGQATHQISLLFEFLAQLR